MTSSDTSGILYLVATPIGNLKDFTYRAVEILQSVSLIAAEDTRHSKILLSHYKIQTPMISYFEHNRFSRIPKIIETLKSGSDVAIISDAGTPGISDPAYKLVRAAIDETIRIESIPGSSALLSALISSGLPTDRFLFEGFIPSKKGRKKRLEAIKNENATLVFFENPQRIARTLKDIYSVIGERPAVLARELTKMHEEIIRGTVSELMSYFSNKSPKGECVLMIGKNDPNVYF
ncbi:MAG: 16S rRNA (cytidine(1402)-2'-O)-methyltransferase [Fidelibacterota bacterium]